MSFFLAVDPPDTVRAEVAGVIESGRAQVPASWLKVEKLHVTVLFLGEVLTDGELESKVGRLAKGFGSFRLTLAGVGHFETARAASVLWLGVAGERERLHALHETVRRGLEVNDRPYVPHLTLARAKRAQAFEMLLPTLERFQSSAFEVSQLTLYESTHSQYRVVWQVDLSTSG